MPVSIINFLSTDFDFTISKDNKSCTPSFNGDKPLMFEPIEGLPTFYSEEEKIFLKIPNSIYHFLHDVLPTMLKLFEFNNNVLFILDFTAMKDNAYDKNIFNFTNKILKDYNIKHKILYDMSYNIIPKEAETTAGIQNLINMNNFYYRDFRSIDHIYSGLLNKYFSKYIINKNIKPHKKVFVSRMLNKTDDKVIVKPEWDTKFTRSFVERIDDEQKLANFFSNHGFEIVYPENFDSLEEQLNYFYEVKTIASLSGGSLSNSIFMQEGTNMIEIVSTMMSPFNYPETNIVDWQEYHGHFYSSIAFQKRQNYFGINNINASSDIIIDRLSRHPLITLLGDDL